MYVDEPQPRDLQNVVCQNFSVRRDDAKIRRI